MTSLKTEFNSIIELYDSIENRIKVLKITNMPNLSNKFILEIIHLYEQTIKIINKMMTTLTGFQYFVNETPESFNQRKQKMLGKIINKIGTNFTSDRALSYGWNRSSKRENKNITKRKNQAEILKNEIMRKLNVIDKKLKKKGFIFSNDELFVLREKINPKKSIKSRSNSRSRNNSRSIPNFEINKKGELIKPFLGPRLGTVNTKKAKKSSSRSRSRQ